MATYQQLLAQAREEIPEVDAAGLAELLAAPDAPVLICLLYTSDAADE